MRRSFRLYVFLAWLYTRIRWGIEWTRLRMPALRPAAEIHTIAHRSEQPGKCRWIYDENQFTIVSTISDQDQFVVRKLMTISEN
ncbi:hypothetical protein JW960_00370 [candidate division KSB1 bacterium]|nr:hypothetical protein [candidate division KSB1 bacterium]